MPRTVSRTELLIQSLELACLLTLPAATLAAFFYRKGQSLDALELKSFEDASLLKDEVERLFARVVLLCAPEIETFSQPYSIILEKKGHPLHGRRTLPDFLLRQTATGREAFIEVTKGDLSHPRKRRQQTIMRAANIADYHQITAQDVEALAYSRDLYKTVIERFFPLR